MLYYRPHIISWWFCVSIFSLDGIVISKDIAILGYDVDFGSKVDARPHESKINDLTFELGA